MSADGFRQSDNLSVAQWRDGFQRHVARPLDGPLIVLLQQDRANEPDDVRLAGFRDRRCCKVRGSVANLSPENR
jgi:hypothetical protein